MQFAWAFCFAIDQYSYLITNRNRLLDPLKKRDAIE